VEVIDLAWNSHAWSTRRLELSSEFPLLQQMCRKCDRNFIDELESGARYAVHVGVTRFARLSEEVTARWLADPCPGEPLKSDDADLKTRSSASAPDYLSAWRVRRRYVRRQVYVAANVPGWTKSPTKQAPRPSGPALAHLITRQS
jgi:hypothetical protein